MATPSQPAPFSTPLQSQTNGMATAGLIMGISGIVLCWLPFIGMLLGLLGIIFGAIGMAKAGKLGGRGKGSAIAGLVCGILSFFFTGIAAAVAIPAFLEYMNKSKRTEASLELRSMETKIKSFYYEKGRLPKSATEMPEPFGLACTSPGQKLPVKSQMEWNAAGWNEIGFHIYDESRYSYRWTAESDRKGYAEALIDADCDGIPAITRVDFEVEAGNLTARHAEPSPD
jgi:hypothetical protein